MATTVSALRCLVRSVIDFALPPRCAGCGEIIDEVDGFCAACWLTLEWLGNEGCEQCGMPLEATDAALCGRCLAAPPPLERIRAAVAYGPLSRVIALKLKYGRKVALARTMARFMAPLRGSGEAIVVPVPLHRRRLWARGFNQSGLGQAIGDAVAAADRPASAAPGAADPAVEGDECRPAAKRAERGVRGGRRAPARRADGDPDRRCADQRQHRRACAKALRKAGAGRVELISWARVVRPSRIMR